MGWKRKCISRRSLSLKVVTQTHLPTLWACHLELPAGWCFNFSSHLYINLWFSTQHIQRSITVKLSVYILFWIVVYKKSTVWVLIQNILNRVCSSLRGWKWYEWLDYFQNVMQLFSHYLSVVNVLYLRR